MLCNRWLRTSGPQPHHFLLYIQVEDDIHAQPSALGPTINSIAKLQIWRCSIAVLLPLWLLNHCTDLNMKHSWDKENAGMHNFPGLLTSLELHRNYIVITSLPIANDSILFYSEYKKFIFFKNTFFRCILGQITSAVFCTGLVMPLMVRHQSFLFVPYVCCRKSAIR